MEEILKHFPNLSEQQIAQFRKLGPLYSEWNEKINVISRKDIEGLYEKHILHSLGIATVIHFKEGSDILDIGTGGGFPGIPLAILFPKCNFHLVDSIGKKITVVNEVANALGLTNVFAEQKRAEKIKNQYDFIVSRAVTQMPKFMGWIQGKIKKKDQNSIPNGILYLKGGDLKEELANYPHALLHPLAKVFSAPFFETKKVVFIPWKG